MSITNIKDRTMLAHNDMAVKLANIVQKPT